MSVDDHRRYGVGTAPPELWRIPGAWAPRGELPAGWAGPRASDTPRRGASRSTSIARRGSSRVDGRTHTGLRRRAKPAGPAKGSARTLAERMAAIAADRGREGHGKLHLWSRDEPGAPPPPSAPLAARTWGYVRVSTDEQVEHGGGLEVQAEMVRAEAAARGLVVFDVLRDEGVSGGLLDRPALTSLLGWMRSGDTVIIPRLDRLARDLIVQEQLLTTMWAAGITVVTCAATEQVYLAPDDPKAPDRKLIRQVLGAVAEYERAMIRARTHAGLLKASADGKRVSRWAPYGYVFDEAGKRCVPNVDEQRMLRWWLFLRRAGYSWAAITEASNNAGLRTRNGGAWMESPVRQTLGSWAKRHGEPLPEKHRNGSQLGADPVPFVELLRP